MPNLTVELPDNRGRAASNESAECSSAHAEVNLIIPAINISTACPIALQSSVLKSLGCARDNVGIYRLAPITSEELLHVIEGTRNEQQIQPIRLAAAVNSSTLTLAELELLASECDDVKERNVDLNGRLETVLMEVRKWKRYAEVLEHRVQKMSETMKKQLPMYESSGIDGFQSRTEAASSKGVPNLLNELREELENIEREINAEGGEAVEGGGGGINADRGLCELEKLKKVVHEIRELESPR